MRNVAGVDLPAAGYALSAALLFAIATNAQRGAAAQVPDSAGGPVRLIGRLLRSPRWLVGSLLAFGALGLHAVALARGGVILVQTILASGLIMALAIEAARERRWMRPLEVTGSLLLVGGVVLLLGWGQPGGGRLVDLGVQVQSGVVVAVVAAVGLAASRARSVSRSAVVMGAAAGVCFAIDAVLLKGVANYADDLDALPAVVSLAGFVVASLLGNLIVQRAYQRAPLRIVLPAVSAADPLAAFLAGVLLLDERLRDGLLARVAVGVGLVLIVVGIILTTAGHRLRPTPDAGRPPG